MSAIRNTLGSIASALSESPLALPIKRAAEAAIVADAGPRCGTCKHWRDTPHLEIDGGGSGECVNPDYGKGPIWMGEGDTCEQHQPGS